MISVGLAVIILIAIMMCAGAAIIIFTDRAKNLAKEKDYQGIIGLLLSAFFIIMVLGVVLDITSEGGLTRWIQSLV